VRIRSLQAEAFRNLHISHAGLSPGITVLHGDNAQGKTNFLEAVYFCALGRPLRADHIGELVPLHPAEKTARLRGEFAGDDGPNQRGMFTIDACIARQGGKYMKMIAVDKIPVKNTRELFGMVPVVSFAPEDTRLIKDGPVLRRRFMDIEICQLSPAYYTELREYTRTLRQRNHLLKTIQKDHSQAENLSVWDAQLVRHGIRVMNARSAFIKKISAPAGEIHREITQGSETLTLSYKPGTAEIDANTFLTALERNQKRDIQLGSTSVGAHRDDVIFTISNRENSPLPARSFGSQGQTRTAILSVKMAEIALMRERMGTCPILLLDDVFSELDAARQKFLLERLHGVQVLLTCTGVEDVLPKITGDAQLICIKDGRVITHTHKERF
jgi:DNA replication and repair protein RecF